MPNYYESLVRQAYDSSTCRLNTSNFTRVELYLNLPIQLQDNAPIFRHKDDLPNEENVILCTLVKDYIEEIANGYINSLSHVLWKIERIPGKEPTAERLTQERTYFDRYGEIRKLTPEPGEYNNVEEYIKNV